MVHGVYILACHYSVDLIMCTIKKCGVLYGTVEC